MQAGAFLYLESLLAEDELGPNNSPAKTNTIQGRSYARSQLRQKGTRTMLEIIRENPWLIIPCLALLIPILGIIFGSTTKAWSSVRRAEMDAALKQDMLQRGMSADEIRTVLEASSQGRSGKQRCGAANAKDWSHAAKV